MALRLSTWKIAKTFCCLYCSLENRFKTLASQSKDELVSLGFPSFTIEDFHQVVSSISIYISSFCIIISVVEEIVVECKAHSKQTE